MAWLYTSALTCVALSIAVSGQHTWPNPKLDELESLLYDQFGYNNNGIVAGALRPCTLFNFGDTPGRSNAADWIRTAYHDMATFNINDGTGGLDGSIRLEQNRAENEGDGFFNTIRHLALAMNRHVSLADILAMGAAEAMEQCGGPKIPFRGGRVDAASMNSPGVPQPQEDLQSHTAAFARQGFNAAEMISLIACGHSFGGVQSSSFPTIVSPDPNAPDTEVQATFDTTPVSFDNKIATEYVAGTTVNVLVSGHNTTTNSDLRIFSSDGNATMQAFANSPELFSKTCATLFERMLNTVPRGVELSEVIKPLPVKPKRVLLKYMGDGGLLLSGETRFWDMVEDASRTITLRWADREGVPCADCSAQLGHISEMTSEALSDGVHHSLWYSMNQTATSIVRIDDKKGISKFWYEITEGGQTRLEDQGGTGFALQDAVTFANSSCVDRTGFPPQAFVDIAVRADKTPSRVVVEWDMLGDVGAPTTVNIVEAAQLSTSQNGTYRLWQAQTGIITGSLNGLVMATAKIDGQRFETALFAPLAQPDCAAP